MNITCEQCGKRYKMKAKQSKKAFKTRCKRCDNVIIVRPEEHATSAQAAEQHSADANAPQQSTAIWYAVINGQQSGPFTENQLQEYLLAGTLEKQSFVWCEGMANWEALENIPQLAKIFQSMPTPQPVTSAAAVMGSTNTTPKAEEASPYAHQAMEHEAQLSRAIANEDRDPGPALSMSVQVGHSRNLLSQSQESPQEQQASAQSASAESHDHNVGQFTDQRNENSVLFSLDSIDGTGGLSIKNDAPKNLGEPLGARPSIGVSNTGGSEGSGLIDLSALSALTGNTMGDAQQGPAPINLSVGVKKMGGGRSLTNRGTDLKTIALAVSSTALVLILGLIGYQKFVAPPPAENKPIVLGNTATSTQFKQSSQLGVTSQSMVKSKEETQEKSAVSNVNPTADKETEEVNAKPKVSTTVKAKTRSSRKQKARNKSKRRSSNSKKRRSGSSKSNRNRSRSSRSGSSSKKSEAKALLSNLKGGRNKKSGSSLSLITGSKPKKSGPKKPSKKAIVSAMRRVNLNSCLGREPSLKGKGRIKVRIVAVSSGAIKSAKVLNAPFKSSPIGACLEREVRRQRFPSFTDPDISFTFPFKN